MGSWRWLRRHFFDIRRQAGLARSIQGVESADIVSSWSNRVEAWARAFLPAPQL
jgi:hypothetical protein